jgi:hypothetical protein
MIAYAFLTKTPNNDLIAFAQKLYDKYHYHIYIFVDDNSYEINDISGINFVKINKEDCIKHKICYCNEKFPGAIHHNQSSCKVLALDKAVYYFVYVNKTYDHIWLIEDDVFIPSVDAFYNLDNKYHNSDLLSAKNNKCLPHEEDVWFWPYALKCFKHPVYCSMMCCCRLSSRLLDKIKDYAILNGFIPFFEFSFNTIAMQNDLHVDCPKELSSIVWQEQWKIDDFKKNPNHFFHPLKEFDKHEYYRSCL